jgi:hypothetical protein
MALEYPSKKSCSHGNPYARKLPFLNLVEFFFFQNDVFKLQKDFSDLEIRVFIENGLENFQKFLILQI